MTQLENRTAKGMPIVIHAEGVFGAGEGQAFSSTPEACGVVFHQPRRKRVSPTVIW